MRHTLAPAAALAFVALLAACGDEVTDPGALMDAAEAEAVMASAESLPLLPRMLESVTTADVRDDAALTRARELWDVGAAVDNPRGRLRRRLAIGYALPVLVDVVPEGEWLDARRRIDDWLRTATDMLRQVSMPRIEARLAAAERHLDRADRATSERTRINHLLLAGSELVETTPAYVAHSMALEAAAAVARAREQSTLSERAFERAERLKNWSALAVEKGEYLLAIQRAYYAIQIAEGE